MLKLINFNKQSGYSLLEALVAVSILALTLVAVVGIFPFVLKINKLAEYTTLASNYAKSELEDILVKPYDEVEVGTIEARHRLSTNPQDQAYNIERQTIVTLVNAELLPSGSDLGLKKISVTVWWPGQFNATNSLTINSLLSKK